MPVKCLDCDRLTRVFELSLAEYFEARAVPFFRVCRKLAAHKKVDMERARYDLEEHRLDCHFVPPGISTASGCGRRRCQQFRLRTFAALEK